MANIVCSLSYTLRIATFISSNEFTRPDDKSFYNETYLSRKGLLEIRSMLRVERIFVARISFNQHPSIASISLYWRLFITIRDKSFT